MFTDNLGLSEKYGQVIFTVLCPISFAYLFLRTRSLANFQLEAKLTKSETLVISYN